MRSVCPPIWHAVGCGVGVPSSRGPLCSIIGGDVYMLKRWLAGAFIVAYLSALGLGVVSHALAFQQNAHPMMYFVVWDMFCGWSAYASRTHVIAEGESGKFYRLTPTPWGEYHPYSDLGRQHYDPFSSHCQRIGTNVLRHTRHEPISRMWWPCKRSIEVRCAHTTSTN